MGLMEEQRRRGGRYNCDVLFCLCFQSPISPLFPMILLVSLQISLKSTATALNTLFLMALPPRLLLPPLLSPPLLLQQHVNPTFLLQLLLRQPHPIIVRDAAIHTHDNTAQGQITPTPSKPQEPHHNTLSRKRTTPLKNMASHGGRLG